VKDRILLAYLISGILIGVAIILSFLYLKEHLSPYGFYLHSPYPRGERLSNFDWYADKIEVWAIDKDYVLYHIYQRCYECE